MINNGNITKCPSAEDLTSILIDNEGGTGTVRTMQEHVQSCAKCSSLLHEYRNTGELVQKHRDERIGVSPSFTNNVMDAIYTPGYEHLLEDIIGLSRKAVTACLLFVAVLLAFTMLTGNNTIDIIIVDEFRIINGVESEVLGKEEITYDDVVSLALTQR